MRRDDVERSIELESGIQEVWAALTRPERLSTWFGADVVEVELRPGGRITFERTGAAWRGLVEAVEPPRRFAFRWLVREGHAGEMRTRVEFVLEPSPTGTVLTVRETPLWGEPSEAPTVMAGAAG
jgi:uncharacterized protein YndB with AHSA1/START domain